MANLIPISTVVVGSGGAANITFSSIPGTYTDLKVVYSFRTDNPSNVQSIGVQLNSTTSGYSYRVLYGTGGTVASTNSGSAAEMYVGEANGANATASTFGNGEFYLANYTSGNAKGLSADAVSENNASGTGSAFAFLGATLSGVTAAVTSITVRPFGGSQTIQQYSTATLYGIRKY